MTDTTNIDLLWKNEGGASISPLVKTIAQNGGWDGRNYELDTLYEQAVALVKPVIDWVRSAEGAGYIPVDEDHRMWRKLPGEQIYRSAVEACKDNNIKGEVIEVEHTVVSTWLAKKLKELGEKVEADFGGVAIWVKPADVAPHDHKAIQKIAASYDPDDTLTTSTSPRP